MPCLGAGVPQLRLHHPKFVLQLLVCLVRAHARLGELCRCDDLGGELGDAVLRRLPEQGLPHVAYEDQPRDRRRRWFDGEEDGKPAPEAMEVAMGHEDGRILDGRVSGW